MSRLRHRQKTLEIRCWAVARVVVMRGLDLVPLVLILVVCWLRRDVGVEERRPAAFGAAASAADSYPLG
eukprot:2686885-Pleurochrysis_carterae.AAC.1